MKCRFNYENVGRYILDHLQGSALADLGYGGKFRVHMVAINFCLQQ